MSSSGYAVQRALAAYPDEAIISHAQTAFAHRRELDRREIRFAELFPGQATAGFEVVGVIAAELRAVLPGGRRARFDLDPLSVIIGPEVPGLPRSDARRNRRSIWLVSNIERALAAVEVDLEIASAVVIGDWRELEWDRFKALMKSGGFVQSTDRKGEPVKFGDLPRQLADVEDDRFRSLALAARRAGQVADWVSPSATQAVTNALRSFFGRGHAPERSTDALDQTRLLFRLYDRLFGAGYVPPALRPAGFSPPVDANDDPAVVAARLAMRQRWFLPRIPMSVGELFPSQGAIGFGNAARRRTILERFDHEGQMRELRDDPVAVVLGPPLPYLPESDPRHGKPSRWIVDGHHQAYAAWQLEISEIPVVVVADWVGVSWSQFRHLMRAAPFVQLVDQRGVRIDFESLPRQIGEMPDDPLRTVSAFARREGYWDRWLFSHDEIVVGNALRDVVPLGSDRSEAELARQTERYFRFYDALYASGYRPAPPVSPVAALAAGGQGLQCAGYFRRP